MLDGMVALASGKASLRGELLNDLPDRVSDVMIFVGVAHSGLCHPASGYWAAIFALLTAYVGTFGQALGVGRQFGGMMAKPWRMVVLHVGAWITLGLLWSGRSIQCGPLTVLDWTCLVVVAGCLQTIAVRLARIMRGLAANKRNPSSRANRDRMNHVSQRGIGQRRLPHLCRRHAGPVGPGRRAAGGCSAGDCAAT